MDRQNLFSISPKVLEILPDFIHSVMLLFFACEGCNLRERRTFSMILNWKVISHVAITSWKMASWKRSHVHMHTPFSFCRFPSQYHPFQAPLFPHWTEEIELYRNRTLCLKPMDGKLALKGHIYGENSKKWKDALNAGKGKKIDASCSQLPWNFLGFFFSFGRIFSHLLHNVQVDSAMHIQSSMLKA